MRKGMRNDPVKGLEEQEGDHYSGQRQQNGGQETEKGRQDRIRTLSENFCVESNVLLYLQ